uniref:Checkpoint protein n=1 Tax=Parascaris equorum TaxID=6256 RepID=A0A914SIU9_PAREQ
MEMVSHLCKERVTLRITNDAMIFINAGFARSNGIFMQISLVVQEFFSTFTMAGVSEEFNEICMEFDKDYLFRSINPKERATKIRLTKIGNIPHIKVEQKTSAIVHEMPVDLIPIRQWKHYAMPAIDDHLLYLKTIRANQRGELHLVGDMDVVQVGIHLSRLTCPRLDNAGDGDEGNASTFYEVCVDIRSVHSLLRSIVPGKMAVFSIEQEEASLTRTNIRRVIRW